MRDEAHSSPAAGVLEIVVQDGHYFNAVNTATALYQVARKLPFGRLEASNGKPASVPGLDTHHPGFERLLELLELHVEAFLSR